MKNSLLFFLLMAVAGCTFQEHDERTRFFPKTEEVPEPLPDKSTTWVFLMAGQSNMAGRGLVQPEDTISNRRILTINSSGKLILAKEPLHFYEPTLTGLDCGLSFGKEMLTYVPDSITILLIPTAVGGSSIGQWLGDSVHRDVRLLTNFTEKVAIAREHGQIKGILWHQGESDANETDIPPYKSRLTQLFRTFREIVGNPNLPIVMGELGSFSEDKEDWLKINNQMHAYASTDAHVRIFSTSDLSDKGDRIHFDSEGQRTMGKRFAKACTQLVQ